MADKAALVQQRRKQWAEARLLERDLREAKEESGGGGGAAGDTALLDQLTEKISRRVHQELTRDMKKLAPEDQVNLADKMETYLSSELCHTHNCQICFEVMVPPERTPMLLFPCGHTFCRACLERQSKTARPGKKKTCPLCRQPIQSTAENHSLRQLIERFVQQKEVLEKGRADDVDALFPSPAAPNGTGNNDSAGRGARTDGQNNYLTQFQSCSMRHKILSNELSDIRESLGGLRGKRRSNELAKQQLLQERQRICQELELLDEHLGDQQTKIDELSAAEADEMSKAAMIEETLVSLQTELEKVRLLAGMDT